MYSRIFRKKIAIVAIGLFLFVIGLTTFVVARQGSSAAPDAPDLELTKALQGSSDVASGQVFTYILAYKCASILENCEGAVITDPLPIEVEFVGLTSNPVHVDSAAYTPGTHSVIYSMIDPLPAGSTGILKIDVRFPDGTLPGTVASNQAEFTATGATTVQSQIVDATAVGQFEMFPQKSLIGEAVIGFPTTFLLEVCSPDSIGGVNLLSAEFVDQLPANATFVTAQGVDGTDWVYDGGAHTVTFNNLPDATVGVCLSRTVTVIYDTDPGGIETNTLTVTGTPEGCDGSISPLPTHCAGVTGDITLGPVGVDFSLIPPYPEATGGKSSVAASTFIGQAGEGGGGTTEALPGEAVTYTVSAQNTGYVTFTNAIVTDTIPTAILLSGFTITPAEQITITGFYEVDGTGTWVALPGNPYSALTTIDATALDLSGGSKITALRWELGQLAAQGHVWGVQVYGTVDAGLPTGTVIQNCMGFSAETPSDGIQFVGNCNDVNVIAQRAVPRVQKTNHTGPYLPSEEVTYQITFRNDAVAHLDFTDPVVADLLPVEFELITDSIQFLGTASGFTTPTQTIENNYNGTGQTLIRWDWIGAVAPGEELIMQLTARVIDFTAPGRYYNTAALFPANPANNPAAYYCDGQPTEYTDTLDLDGDSDTSEMSCQNPATQGYADIAVFLSMESQKFVQGARDSFYQKLGLSYQGGAVDWQMVLTNTSNVSTTNIIVYDILPYIGDTGVIDSANRQSEWRPNMIGPVVAPLGLPMTIYYSQEQNPCRPEVTNAAGCVDDWTTTFPADPTSVQALKFEFCDGGGCLELPIGDSVEFAWPMVAPNDAPVDPSCENAYDPNNYQGFAVDNPDCPIAWNSFAFTAEGSGLQLLPAEPLRVGVRLSQATGLALGNLVWLDVAGIEKNHIQEVFEQENWGISGVRVELYDAVCTNLLDFTYTGPDHLSRPGYYEFNDLVTSTYCLRFYPPAGYTVSNADQGGDDAVDSDGVTAGTDGTYGDYWQTADILLSADDFSWDLGLWAATDYGDLPYDGVGLMYPVISAGVISPELAARHVVSAGLQLGTIVDTELDGQPTISAEGDDFITDDEDGIFFKMPLVSGRQTCIDVTAVNTVSQQALLSGWIDYNGDGTFDQANEQILADVRPDSGTDLGSGVYEHCFNVVASTVHSGTLYSRFRLSTDENLSVIGTASDGEVEDYALEVGCVGNFVFDDNDYNDVQSAGDVGVSGIAVKLVWGGSDGVIGTGSDDKSFVEYTDANGEYHFCGLQSDPSNDGLDEYQLTVMTVPGLPVASNQGGDDALDSDGDPATNQSPVFIVPLPNAVNDNAGNDNAYEGYADDHDNLSFDFGYVVEYDWGDLPDNDVDGNTNDNYATTITNTLGQGVGANHRIITDLYLGNCVDGEDDGQPSAPASAAIGDDADDGLHLAGAGSCIGNDDEDGIVFVTPLIPGNQACVQVTASTVAAQNAKLSGWIDFNNNGVLFDAGEHVINGVSPNVGVDLGGGVYELCFPINATVTHSTTLYSRFRLSTDMSLLPTGAASNGEVEDYALPIQCVGNYVFADADGSDTQTAGDIGIATVPVTLSWGGSDGVIGGGDDITYTVNTDNAGLYHFCGLIADGEDAGSGADEYQLTVSDVAGVPVSAEQGGNAALDSDGDSNGTSPIFSLPTSNINSDDAANDISGNSGSGVPDTQDDLSFDFGFLPQDMGDLPDSDSGSGSFATNLTDSGEGTAARHVLSTAAPLHLGQCVDAEFDGTPTAAADGDNSTTGFVVRGTCTATDDEDGVKLITPLIAGSEACVSVTAALGGTAQGVLQGWIDFNGDADFAGDAADLLMGQDFATGSITITADVTNQSYCFDVPSDAVTTGGETYMRFRFSEDGLTPDDSATLSYAGPADTGEVEDYALNPAVHCVGNYIWADLANDDVQGAGDSAIAGLEVALIWGGADGLLATAGDNTVYTTTTAIDGRYQFCGLLPDVDGDATEDEYQIAVPTAPAAFQVVVAADQGSDDAADSDGAENVLIGAITYVSAAPVFTVTVDTAGSADQAANDTSGLAGGVPDDHDNLAFDFGFVADQTAISLGFMQVQNPVDLLTALAATALVTLVTVTMFSKLLYRRKS